MEAFNASRLSAPEVASTFVPPFHAFSQLATKNHCLLIGPRGSGKTTLLKMLTPSALSSWRPEESSTVLPSVNFVGVFVGADRAWQKQLTGERHDEAMAGAGFGKVAFTTHVLSQLVSTFRTLRSITPAENGPLGIRPSHLEGTAETAFVEAVSDVWQVKPRLRSLEGLVLALSARLAEIGRLRREAAFVKDPGDFFSSKAPYRHLSYAECISFAIESFHIFTETDKHSWAFLLDEFEIAPSELQSEIVENCRAKDPNIIYKIAIAPFNESFSKSMDELDPSANNDFVPVELWYPRKVEAQAFSDDLVLRMLKEQGVKSESLPKIFQNSELSFKDEAEDEPYEADGSVRKAFEDLSRKDPTFRTYCRDQDISFSRWRELPEAKRAEVRKLRSIVIARNYFRGTGRARSRKISQIYAGYPTILEIADGNPRLLISIMAPLMRELSVGKAKSANARIPLNLQAASVQSASSAFRSLLRTIPYEPKLGGGNRGILSLLDKIGKYFYEKLVISDFSPQPPLSFTVDSNADGVLIDAIARALNIGAIIHVPDPGADPILKSIAGKRFRLCYLLAAHYKLPIMLNTSVSLGAILKKGSTSNQRELFVE
ncbi:MAG: hypothetical protein INR68_08995 [Methylobacterium mesophilicum]|nr:hypothetical protein [Methylobacterium mesophilicum]